MLARRRVSFRLRSLFPRNPCSRSASSTTVLLETRWRRVLGFRSALTL